jgi:hypothetical protein
VLLGTGKVIGPKGKTVQMLIDTNALTNIDVQDDGSIQVRAFVCLWRSRLEYCRWRLTDGCFYCRWSQAQRNGMLL